MTGGFTLTAAELDGIFARQITARLGVAGAGPVERPDAVMFAAQPAPGSR